MSLGWWFVIVPLSYLTVGWGISWREAVTTVRARESCRRCGRVQGHAETCTCTICRDRLWVCPGHETDSSLAVMLLWPLWVLILGCGFIKVMWDVINPGRIAEASAERRKMRVIVPGKGEVD